MATEFEYRHRSWLIALVFIMAYSFYNLDDFNVVYAIVPSEDFESIARRYFVDPDLIAPGIRAGSKLEAFAFLARMLFTRVPDFDRWEDEHLLPRIQSPELAQSNEAWRRHASAKELYLLQGNS